MRLAVVSDIHGNLPALEAVLAEVRGEHVDRVVNLRAAVAARDGGAAACDVLVHDPRQP